MVIETRSGRRYLAWTDPEFGLRYDMDGKFIPPSTLGGVNGWYKRHKDNIPWGVRTAYSRDGYLTCYKQEQ